MSELDKIVKASAVSSISNPIPHDGGEDAGGGDGGGAAGSSADAAPKTILTEGPKPEEGDNSSENTDNKQENSDNQNSDDDKKSEDEGKESDKGKDKTDQDDGPLTLQTPEGFEQFQEDFDKFASDMDPWLKDNPSAAPKDILAEAARRQAELVTQNVQKDIEAVNSQIEGWLADAKKDKEIGGANFDENIAVAQKAIEAFGDQELKDVLNEFGVGNHPAVIRAFVKAGAQLKESPVLKGAAAAQNMSLSDALYGNKQT